MPIIKFMAEEGLFNHLRISLDTGAEQTAAQHD